MYTKSCIAWKYAKKLNPNTLTILGGPEFPAGTGARTIENSPKDQTYDKCYNYLLKRPSVDYFTYSDGEVSFLEIVENFIKNDFSVEKLKSGDEPIKGCASIAKDKSKLLVGKYIPRLGMEGSIKADGRDVIPSIYLSGMLDKYLNGKSYKSIGNDRIGRPNKKDEDKDEYDITGKAEDEFFRLVVEAEKSS